MTLTKKQKYIIGGIAGAGVLYWFFLREPADAEGVETAKDYMTTRGQRERDTKRKRDAEHERDRRIVRQPVERGLPAGYPTDSGNYQCWKAVGGVQCRRIS